MVTVERVTERKMAVGKFALYIVAVSSSARLKPMVDLRTGRGGATEYAMGLI